MTRVGIIGCGSIGSLIARGLSDVPALTLAALADVDQAKASKLAQSLTAIPQILPSDQLISQVDLVVEAACPQVVPSILEQACRLNKDVLIISIGGMLDLSPHISTLMKESRSRIYLPSGALAGLDAVKAAAGDEIYSATLTTRKPPKGFTGAPYLIQAGIDVNSIYTPTVIFEGTASDAVKAFPQNINVAAALSLAGIGPQKTKVRIIADPSVTTNCHEVEVTGNFGKMIARTENLPFPQNPKTSYLAALSALATLKKIVSPLQIGT
ncbi:MAG: aspartate dehydrogenase [Candidatus Schekmanbacteria bacterium]|nr:aspartate dehydrogenase [Candidatus Schekmanbacteria bacterium]